MEPVPIVSDPAVATRGVGDGRVIPVLIINSLERPDIEDMVRAHKCIGPGDVKSAWAKKSRFNRNKIRLVLFFTKPSSCFIVFEFDIMDQGHLIDQIVSAESVYIQPGRAGDRLASTIDNPRILVEVPSKKFRGKWEQIYSKALYRKFKKHGLSRKGAKESTQKFIEEWRHISATRLDGL